MSALDDLLSKAYGNPSKSDGALSSTPADPVADSIIVREAITLEVVRQDEPSAVARPTLAVTTSAFASHESLQTFTRQEPSPVESPAEVSQDAPDEATPGTTEPSTPNAPQAMPPHSTHEQQDGNGPDVEQPIAPAGTSSDADPEFESKERPFQAQWEVDDFLWPTICQDLRKRIAAELKDAAGKLAAVYQQRRLGAVIVTSARSDAGRTSVTLGVAQELASQGKSVALVDLDHQHPTLMERLGVVVDHGLECLDGQRYTAESVCVRAVEENVTLAPLTAPISSAHCLYEEVQKLLSCLSQYHDVVLIDASAEVAELLSRYASKLQFGTLLVQDLRDDEPQRQMHDLVARVQGNHIHSVGVIENFAA